MSKGLKEEVELLEKELINAALRTTEGVQARAAKELKVSERVLRYKVKKYRLGRQTKMSVRYKNVG